MNNNIVKLRQNSSNPKKKYKPIISKNSKKSFIRD